ncbi:hypothetical protein [Micromonospora sp. NPDC005305]|uniref:hypothetical protein n=1 Tax=Micromonospora sp. NPDC005305 TaxID=3156875 RepID=UPI0033A9DCF0
MTTAITNLAAQERMTPDDYVITVIARDFAGRGELSFERFLSGYYAEALRIIHEAHLTQCTAADGDNCATCDGIRVGLAGLIAEERAVTAGEVTSNGHH